jgi:hypothetical protein
MPFIMPSFYTYLECARRFYRVPVQLDSVRFPSGIILPAISIEFRVHYNVSNHSQVGEGSGWALIGRIERPVKAIHRPMTALCFRLSNLTVFVGA